MRKGIVYCIVFLLVFMVFAGLPSNVAAKDYNIKADSPVNEVVEGKDVTFDWHLRKSSFTQTRFELYTSAGTKIRYSPATQYTWTDFPYGSGWWYVIAYKDSIVKKMETSKQSFYHLKTDFGRQYTDDTTFMYKDGPEYEKVWLGITFTTYIYYEITKDYTISLPEYFDDSTKLPALRQGQAEFFRYWAASLPPCDWDFIRLDEGGVLTIKKGYRWDGASTPWNNWNFFNNREFYLRCSCVHDSIYDLMRMGYLAHDNSGLIDLHLTDNAGDRNRKLADMMLYMVNVEDGRTEFWAQTDFEIVRAGGAPKTRDNDLLYPWKYHVSELTAWASDGKVELHWQPADLSGKDPNEYGIIGDIDATHSYRPHQYSVYRRSSSSLWSYLDSYTFQPANTYTYKDSDVFYTDTNVNNDQTYYYQIKSGDTEEAVDKFYRHYDESYIDAVVPVVKQGNALILDGINDYVDADTVCEDLSGDAITFEAWVYPETQGRNSILAFNTYSGGNFNLLMYDGGPQKFCYYDDNTGYKYSPIQSVPGHWYHVAVTISESDQTTLWINGAQRGIFFTSIRPSKSAKFSIGQEWDGSTESQHFKGQIDEVRIWTDARMTTEIQANICKPLLGNEANLVGLWHFDERFNSLTAYDATVNANDGTLENYLPFDPFYPSFVPSGAMNQPPVADAGGPYEANEGTEITLDTSGSTDPDEDELQYRWDFDNDGEWDTEYSPEPTATHTWNDDYSGEVAVEVYDGGESDTDTATVTVNNVAPTVTASGDTIDEDDIGTVSGTITDPGTEDTFTVVIDWGEGAPETFSYGAGTTSFSETHQYLDDNPTGTSSDTYALGATVNDDDNGVDTAGTTVTVNNVAPTVSIDDMIQPFSEFILPTDILEFYGSYTDPGILDTHTIEWDFDDSTIITGTLTPTHSYTEPGEYTVTLTVTDDDGGTDSVSMDVLVKSPQQATEVIEEIIEEMELESGTENSLNSILDNSIKSLDKGQENAAVNQLEAFINHVEAQRGKKLTEEEADALIAAAQQIIDNINDNGG